jgi:hypothetical protein
LVSLISRFYITTVVLILYLTRPIGCLHDRACVKRWIDLEGAAKSFISAVFRALCLDSADFTAITTANPARVSCAACVLRVFFGTCPGRAKAQLKNHND